MKQVFVARDITEAHFIRGLLESQGLSVMVRGEHLQALAGDVPFPDAYPSVWILDDDFEARARSIVTEYEANVRVKSERHWRCQLCGEDLEEQFTTCWACGTERLADTER